MTVFLSVFSAYVCMFLIILQHLLNKLKYFSCILYVYLLELSVIAIYAESKSYNKENHIAERKNNNE